jgi:type IV pilus assembly protein PilV
MRDPQLQRGGLMIEVLVTITILAIGLVGLMQTQARLQKSEMESYQRTQALMLLNDMAQRITTNRANVANYETTTFLGVGGEAACTSVGTELQDVDSREWCETLQGAAESIGSSGVGAMIGARGCVEILNVAETEYLLTVVWQGLTPISAPPASVSCGAGLYDVPAGSVCEDNPDMCRRYVTTIVRLANLEAI